MNVALLRQSFALVVDRNPAVVSRFYEILFTRYPQARPLFAHTSPAMQSAMLTRALVAVVEHLEDPA
jgi:hemoglobin-like flavoprotein